MARRWIGGSVIAEYSTDVAREPLVAAAREADLASRMVGGDREARDELVRANLRLVFHIADKFAWCGLPYEDLVQEGNLGLVRDAAKFDPALGNRFSTFACTAIRNAMLRAIRRAPLVTVSCRTFERMSAINRRPRPGRPSPPPPAPGSPEEARLERGRMALAITSIHDLPALAAPEDDRDGAPPPDLEALMLRLRPREADVVRRHFLAPEPEPLSQIARTQNVSKERIRQVKESALAKLRAAAESPEGGSKPVELEAKVSA